MGHCWSDVHLHYIQKQVVPHRERSSLRGTTNQPAKHCSGK